LGAPERTCVGCRSRRAQAELIRMTLVDGRVTVAGALPGGRSAYLCPREECLDKALKRAAFKRAFRCEARTDELRELLAHEIAHRKAVS
jgi:predicted RNA-binding protein YlxR (DUF448 family)